jgi:hypothetical protein
MVSCSGLGVPVSSPSGNSNEHFLEEYAKAVRAYQDVVLELQIADLLDRAKSDGILQRAVAAKGIVNHYRGAYRHIASGID